MTASPAAGAASTRDDAFSPPPVETLVNAFSEPFNNAVATARTC